jgi:hypothetical protein
MHHFLQLWECVVGSASDPDSLNRDPGLGILLNPYPDLAVAESGSNPDPGCC